MWSYMAYIALTQQYTPCSRENIGESSMQLVVERVYIAAQLICFEVGKHHNYNREKQKILFLE